MQRLTLAPVGSLLCAAILLLALVGLSAHDDPAARRTARWGNGFRSSSLQFYSQTRDRRSDSQYALQGQSVPGLRDDQRDQREGQRLFERETFGGNGRTCLTCHSRETGTVSPRDAQKRFHDDPDDPLFVHDGSDDGLGNGVTRITTDATILMNIHLAPNVDVKNSTARSVILRRGIPTTINTPALDPVLMYDGRQPNLKAQAAGAIADHAQAVVPTDRQLGLIATFQQTDERFFSSEALRFFARGGPAPGLPRGETTSEKRGRRFFQDIPPDASGKDGLCATCHNGPMLNETNQFLPLPVPPGTRFQTVLVSEINAANNPLITFIFHGQTHGDAHGDIELQSPDPGRALITGIADDGIPGTTDPDTSKFNSLNAFKIPTLRGVRNTAPYFHDNSAKTLEDVAAHYSVFFAIVSDPDGPGPQPPGIILTAQDQADIVAFMKLLR